MSSLDAPTVTFVPFVTIDIDDYYIESMMTTNLKFNIRGLKEIFMYTHRKKYIEVKKSAYWVIFQVKGH